MIIVLIELGFIFVDHWSRYFSDPDYQSRIFFVLRNYNNHDFMGLQNTFQSNNNHSLYTYMVTINTKQFLVINVYV